MAPTLEGIDARRVAKLEAYLESIYRDGSGDQVQSADLEVEMVRDGGEVPKVDPDLDDRIDAERRARLLSIIRDDTLSWLSRDAIQGILARFAELGKEIAQRHPPPDADDDPDLDDSLRTQIMLYLNDELDAEQSSEVEALIERDPTIRWFVEDMRLGTRLFKDVIMPIVWPQYERSDEAPSDAGGKSRAATCYSPAIMWRCHLYRAGLLDPERRSRMAEA